MIIVHMRTISNQDCLADDVEPVIFGQEGILDTSNINAGAAVVEYFPDYIQRHGSEIPESIALLQEGFDAVSWAELASTANRIANHLIGLGCKKGDCIAYMGRNSIAMAELMAGATSAGCVLVPLPTMITAEALQAMLTDCGARVLAVDESCVAIAEDVLPNCPALVEGGLAGLDFDTDRFPGLARWYAGAPDCRPDLILQPKDLFAITYSSGTTGVPKGIMLDHGTRLGQATLMSLAGFVPGAVNLISTPLYSYGAISTWMPTIVGGGTNLLVNKFDAREFLELIQKHKGTHAILVPVQYERIMGLVDFDDFDISSMQFWFGGSAPMTEASKTEIAARLPGEILEMYSLTEGGVTTVLMLKHFPDKLGSVGSPTSGCDLRIIDDEDNEVGPGEIGEIVGRSDLKMSGYLNQKDLSRDIIWRDSAGLEFVRSGDNGRLDEDGFLYLLDRKKDMIISGGFNIYATDIEAVLIQHKDICDVTVVAAPSKQWGETPYALVVCKADRAIDEAEIKVWANERLGKSQRLGGVTLRSELPKNHLGKVQKKQLREELFASGLLLD